MIDLKIAKESKMKIEDVLASKGHDVRTIPPMMTLRQIVHIFVERELSSVIVVSIGGGIMGIVTDRVLIRALSQHLYAALDFPAAEVMTTPIPHCSPGDNVRHAMRSMTEQRVRHLLVIEGDDMLGIVSIGDLVKVRISDAEMENGVLRDLAGARQLSA